MIARILSRIGPTTNRPGLTLALVLASLAVIGGIERAVP